MASCKRAASCRAKQEPVETDADRLADVIASYKYHRAQAQKKRRTALSMMQELDPDMAAEVKAETGSSPKRDEEEDECDERHHHQQQQPPHKSNNHRNNTCCDCCDDSKCDDRPCASNSIQRWQRNVTDDGVVKCVYLRD